MADVHARDRAKRIAQARGLGAMANDTKWREFFSEVIAQKIPVDVKLLYEELPFACGTVWSPSPNYIEGHSGMGPVLFVFIEWVRSSEAMKVSGIAAAVGLACDVHAGLATIHGYRSLQTLVREVHVSLQTAAMGRQLRVVAVRDFPLRQPAMLSRTAEIGQEQTLGQ